MKLQGHNFSSDMSDFRRSLPKQNNGFLMPWMMSLMSSFLKRTATNYATQLPSCVN